MISNTEKGKSKSMQAKPKTRNKQGIYKETTSLSEYYNDFMLTNWCRPSLYDQAAFCTREASLRKPRLAMAKKKEV